MARFKNKKRKVFVKPPVVKKQPNVDQVTGDKIPKSFVLSRGKLPGPLKQLELDLRKIMLPHTALKLKALIVFSYYLREPSHPSLQGHPLWIFSGYYSELYSNGIDGCLCNVANISKSCSACLHGVDQENKRNNLKDFLNIAGPMGVTHFLILSNPKSVPHLRVARTPQGPTLTFEIREYGLAADVARSQARPRCPQELFKNSPLIVLSGFGSGGQHLKLTTIMFQNIFPAIDINTIKLSSCQRIVLLNYNNETKLIDFRHYSIRLQPVGVSRRIRKFVQNHQVPDLRSLQDVSDFVTKAGYGSESEADEEAATVSLASDLGRVNRASTKSAVKLQEIGPRMTLQLVKVEEGLCSGGVIFTEYGEGATEANQETNEED